MFKNSLFNLKYIFIPFVIPLLLITCLLNGCETENPGEPSANLPPDTYISEASAGNTTTISFYGTDKDGFVDKFTYQWQEDISWTETDEQTATFKNLFSSEDEIKIFYVKGIDNNRMEDPTPAEVALTPTNALPETEITGGPTFGSTAGEDVVFTFKGKDADHDGSITKFEYTMDDLDNWRETPVDLPQAIYLGLSTGAHIFYVRAIDNFGGKDPTPAQAAFLVEGGKYAPEVKLQGTVRNGGEWFSGVPLEFSWEASTTHYYGSLPEAPFSFALNDSSNFDINPTTALFSGWTTSVEIKFTPAEGKHAFYLKVRDTAGGITLTRLSFLAATPVFDSGVLVVNGVSPGDYGTSITDRIAQGAYWGSVDIDFWDIFGSMGSPHAAITLPDGIYYTGGGGAVPVTILKQYSTLVWLGNKWAGDFEAWDPTLILGYLLVGGNIILATRWGADFLPADLTNYLNIEWREGSDPGSGAPSSIGEYVAVFPGLKDMSPFTGGMSHTTVFSSYPFDAAGDYSISDADVTDWDGSRGFSKDEYTTLLFAHRSINYHSESPFNFVRGLGVWKHPFFAFDSLSAGNQFPTPGTFEAQGNFILLNGRHYHYDIQNMTENFEFILKNMCGEQN